MKKLYRIDVEISGEMQLMVLAEDMDEAMTVGRLNAEDEPPDDLTYWTSATEVTQATDIVPDWLDCLPIDEQDGQMTCRAWLRRYLQRKQYEPDPRQTTLKIEENK